MPESLRDQPITFGLFVAIIIFVLGAVGWANVNFVSRAEAEQSTKSLSEKIDAIGTQVNFSAAFQMERGFQADLDKHTADKPDPLTRRWLEKQRDIAAKLNIAAAYKNCVRIKGKNCELLQKQLFQ